MLAAFSSAHSCIVLLYSAFDSFESKKPLSSGDGVVVTSLINTARIFPGNFSTISVYTSRSASPESPTRIQRLSGKSRSTRSTVPFLRSATGSKMPWSMPEYCFRCMLPGGSPASSKNDFNTGYSCQGELDT